jgi:hypothetical protein
MWPTTTAHRIYFATVGLFAAWVGVWAYGFPALADNALPWPVPALHARFIGSMYLSGLALMLGAFRARTLEAVRIPTIMAAVWTGMLGLVSFLHIDQFEAWRSTVWFWFFAYVAFPVAGAALALKYRTGPAANRDLPGWISAGAAILSVLCAVMAATLFFATGFAVPLWPWKITPFLAQIYSGPFLSYAIGALLVARSTTIRAVRWPLVSMALFVMLVLAASLLHFGLFDPTGAPAMVWFGGLTVAGAFLLAASFRTLREPVQ